MKVIDLLNKISNGEKIPKRIRIDHWCYEFEWVEHDSNYYDKHADIDLMSCLSMDAEELNYEVRELKEDKKIGKLELCNFNSNNLEMLIEVLNDLNREYVNKINEIIDYLEENK